MIATSALLVLGAVLLVVGRTGLAVFMFAAAWLKMTVGALSRRAERGPTKLDPQLLAGMLLAVAGVTCAVLATTLYVQGVEDDEGRATLAVMCVLLGIVGIWAGP